MTLKHFKELKPQHIPHEKKDRKKLLIAVSFIFVIVLIATSGWTKEIVLTGAVIGGDEAKEGFEMSADLGAPYIDLNGEFSELRIHSSRSITKLLVGKQEISLSDGQNNILIRDFDGDLSFDGDNIYVMNGKSSGVIVNGIPLNPKEGKRLKVGLEDLSYSSLEIKDKVVVRKLDYETTGQINVRKTNKIELDNDQMKLIKFEGDLSSKGSRIQLDGRAEKLEVLGEESWSIG
tara:strand:+ start:4728 stop:5426 length:699 start_codon:yes stop_codon:yes gene_type:complete